MPAVTHSNTPFSANVFVNGGPTLGGAIADALGLEDTVGIDDADARAIISGKAAELAAGNDPDTMEALEKYGGGTPIGTNPITGKEGAEAAPGSDTGIGADGADSDEFERPESEWIIVQNHVNPRVLPTVWNKAIIFAQSMGRPIIIISAYRTPEYNVKVGGAKKSMHTERKAMDVLWGTSSQQGRVDMIQRAVDAGFTGIGCYEDFIHVDTGPKRQWGPSGSSASQYAIYKPILSSNGFADISKPNNEAAGGPKSWYKDFHIKQELQMYYTSYLSRALPDEDAEIYIARVRNSSQQLWRELKEIGEEIRHSEEARLRKEGVPLNGIVHKPT